MHTSTIALRTPAVSDVVSPTPFSCHVCHPSRLLESIFSFIFGDGDPNGDMDQRRVEAAATVSGGGVCSAGGGRTPSVKSAVFLLERLTQAANCRKHKCCLSTRQASIRMRSCPRPSPGAYSRFRGGELLLPRALGAPDLTCIHTHTHTYNVCDK